MIHELKCWPEHFAPAARGEKTFEIRRNDRPYKVGDFLWLMEYFPLSKQYTGHICKMKVTFILDEKPFLPAGYICMATKLVGEP